MQILENTGDIHTGKVKKDDTEIILLLSYKESKIIFESMEEFTKKHKRKINAKKLYKLMYDNLPF